ncbi:DUF3999 family protein [Sandarakinorhabdus sp. DWP1-3-1]|uniref:DUF3999 family protein n=1 Tax=Sandarakinorhabdus sp. DWP1-3-1 TaxID=2804627 RepID=UPI003CEF22D5
MIRPLLIALLIATPGAAKPGDDHAVRLPITPVPGAPLQRLAVPAVALVALREPGLADLRILNGAGAAVPMALADGGRPGRRTLAVPALPILGRPGVLQVTGLTLAFDAARNARVATVAGTVAGADGNIVLGVLFDTRAVRLPGETLALDATVPAMQPVTFTVEASSDLSTWTRVGERTLYRAGPATPGDATVELGGIPLRDRYLRVRWRGDTQLVGAVAVRGATLALTGPTDRLPAPRLAVTPRREPDGALAFELPFATPLATLDVALAGDAELIPVRILGRDNREQPWAVLGAGTLYRLRATTGLRRNAPIALDGRGARQIRIEPDGKAAGFTGTPAVALTLAPVELVFVAQGSAPFTLAAGRPGSKAAFLPLATLMPDAPPSAAATLPAATVAGGSDVPRLVAAATSSGPDRRTLLLWAIILGGAALLGVMVLRLLRRPVATTDGDGGRDRV